MDRKSGKIHFSNEERKKFGVGAVVLPESALQTADSFTVVAVNIQAEAVQNDDITRDAALEAKKHQARAIELALFASQIYQVCAPELAARLSIARNQ